MSATKSICPICGSKRIIHARHDSDWGGGNSCSLANSDDCYTEDDLRDEEQEQIYGDIDIFICKDCNCIWDVYDNDAITSLRSELERVKAENEWMPVGETLKGHNAHRVQIYMKNKYVVIATHYCEGGGDEHFRNDSGDYVDFSDVIAFKELDMTLPTAPEDIWNKTQ